MKSRRAAWLLLVIALVVALAHICTLPSHSHAENTPAHDDSHDADSLHAASCDAVRPVPSAALIPVVAASFTLRLEPPPVAPVMLLATSVSPTASPPLFLLHASLLI